MYGHPMMKAKTNYQLLSCLPFVRLGDLIENIETVLEEAARHLALREDEVTTVISERAEKSPEESARVTEVLEYVKEQNKDLNEAFTQATGKTAAEWAKSEEIKPRPDRKKNPNSWKIDPTLSEEEEDLDLPDDWIDRYTAGLEEPRPQSVGKGVTQVDLPKYNGLIRKGVSKSCPK